MKKSGAVVLSLTLIMAVGYAVCPDFMIGPVDDFAALILGGIVNAIVQPILAAIGNRNKRNLE
ncbi:MAG: hypothetical protein J6B54_00160 [Clostridia bacterium]|nr:hypothetical protein [Clostridia bacterium]